MLIELLLAAHDIRYGWRMLHTPIGWTVFGRGGFYFVAEGHSNDGYQDAFYTVFRYQAGTIRAVARKNWPDSAKSIARLFASGK